MDWAGERGRRGAQDRIAGGRVRRRRIVSVADEHEVELVVLGAHGVT
jgi:hypothetical protein